MNEFNGTPHNTAKVGDFAKTVLMPGDPLRAKWIAETFLEDAKCFNTVRGMLGYTGKYKGLAVIVFVEGALHIHLLVRSAGHDHHLLTADCCLPSTT